MARTRSSGYYTPPQGRMDLRPQSDPAVRSGMRRIHRGMNGEAIGGITAEGERVGVSRFANRRDPDKWMIDAYRGNRMGQKSTEPSEETPNPSVEPVANAAPMKEPRATLKMDYSSDQGQIRTFDPAARRKEELEIAHQAELQGRFGTGYQQRAMERDRKKENLSGRQSLFRDMEMAGSGGITKEMKSRASELGIDRASWRRGLSKISAAPKMVQAPTNLEQRKSLFHDMTYAADDELPKMRKRAAELGVDDEGWARATKKLGINPSFAKPQAQPPASPAARPAMPMQQAPITPPPPAITARPQSRFNDEIPSYAASVKPPSTMTRRKI